MSTNTSWRETLKLWIFSFSKIPLIWWLKPRVITLSNDECIIRMPFKKRVRNHVGSMYFGALCVGAELAAGLLTMNLLRKQKSHQLSFIIKDYEAHFFKRFEGDVYFVCDEGHLVTDAITRVLQTNARQHIEMNVIATVPSRFGNEPIGRFSLTISIK